MNIPTALRAPLAVMFLAFSAIVAGVALGITNNANHLRDAVYDSCVARNAIETNSNELLDHLIDSAAKSTVFSPAEKAERIAGWRAVRHSTESCVR